MGDTIQTVEDLGKKLKAKYPGSYDDIADAELGSRLKAKHPEYSDFADVPGSGAMPNLKGTPVGGVEGAAPIVGRMAAESLPAVGATVGEMVEPAGGGILGAGAGSVAKRMLKSKFPKYFGEQEENPVDAGVDVAKDMAVQGGMGALATGANMSGKAILGKILSSRPAQALPSVERATEGAAARSLENMGGREGVDIREVLKAGSTGSGKYNPEKIMTALDHPDYDFTISPEAKKNVSDFAANLHSLKAGEGSTNYLINYAKGHLLLMAPSLALGASGHLAPAAATAGGLVLTDAVLGRLMKNPETAALVVRAMRTSSEAPEADIIQKALRAAARGSAQEATVPDK